MQSIMTILRRDGWLSTLDTFDCLSVSYIETVQRQHEKASLKLDNIENASKTASHSNVI